MTLLRLLFVYRLRVLLSDWRFLLAMLAVPLFLSAITGNALERQKRTEMSLLVVDQDRSEFSRELLQGLEGKSGLAVSVAEREAARKQVEDNEVEAYLLIPEGYGDRFARGDLTGFLELETAASADSRGFLTELVAAEVFRLSGRGETLTRLRDIFASSGLTLTVEQEKRALLLYAEASEIRWLDVRYETIQARTPEKGTVNYPAAVASSLGLLVLFVFFGMLFGAGWLVEERRNGTLSRLVAAHGASLAWYVSNWLAMCAIGLGLTTVLLGGSSLLAGEPPIRGGPSWVLLLSYIACVASIGMLMSSLFPSAARLQAATPVIAIVSGFAGGCLWNQMGMVGGLPFVALATPQGWVLQALGRLYANPADQTWRQAVLVLCTAAAISGLLGWLLLQRAIRRGAAS